MNIKSLTQTQPEPTGKGSAMLVNYSKCEATPTQWIAQFEAEVLARAEAVTKVENADDQLKAVEAQASLAMYIRRIQEAETKAKAPLNLLRGKILDLSKQLIAKADEAGNRLGKLVADFQTAENARMGAIRRLQDKETSSLEQERDKRLSKAQSVEEMDQIRDEFNQQIADIAQPMEPARVKGQVVKEDFEIEVFDIFLLVRAHPVCVKMTPLLSEIKSLLNAGVNVAGVRARKVTKSSVRLGKEQPAITV